MRAGVEPGIATAEPVDMQFPTLEISVVDRRDLELASRRGPDRGGDIDDPVVVEIEAGDSPVRFRLERLFLDGQRLARGLVEGDHAVALGILDVIGEDGGAAFALR